MLTLPGEKKNKGPLSAGLCVGYRPYLIRYYGRMVDPFLPGTFATLYYTRHITDLRDWTLTRARFKIQNNFLIHLLKRLTSVAEIMFYPVLCFLLKHFWLII